MTEELLQTGSDSIMREGKWAGKFFRNRNVYFDEDSRKCFLKVLGPHELPSRIVFCLKCCFLIGNLLNLLKRPKG